MTYKIILASSRMAPADRGVKPTRILYESFASVEDGSVQKDLAEDDLFYHSGREIRSIWQPVWRSMIFTFR